MRIRKRRRVDSMGRVHYWRLFTPRPRPAEKKCIASDSNPGRSNHHGHLYRTHYDISTYRGQGGREMSVTRSGSVARGRCSTCALRVWSAHALEMRPNNENAHESLWIYGTQRSVHGATFFSLLPVGYVKLIIKRKSAYSKGRPTTTYTGSWRSVHSQMKISRMRKSRWQHA